MKNITTQIPKWILMVSILFAFLGFMVSSTLLFAPENAIKTVDFEAKGVSYLIQMWAVRQFTVGFIFLYSVLKKSKPMLNIAYIFFLVMNIVGRNNSSSKLKNSASAIGYYSYTNR